MPNRDRHRHLPAPRTCRTARNVGALVVLALLALLTWTSPAAAVMAVIEIAVPLENPAELEAAVAAALARATEGARAMGMPRVHVVSAQLTGQMVVLTVLAADQMLAGSQPAPGALLPASLVEP